MLWGSLSSTFPSHDCTRSERRSMTEAEETRLIKISPRPHRSKCHPRDFRKWLFKNIFDLLLLLFLLETAEHPGNESKNKVYLSNHTKTIYHTHTNTQAHIKYRTFLPTFIYKRKLPIGWMSPILRLLLLVSRATMSGWRKRANHVRA